MLFPLLSPQPNLENALAENLEGGRVVLTVFSSNTMVKIEADLFRDKERGEGEVYLSCGLM